jgi:hypothetical protein
MAEINEKMMSDEIVRLVTRCLDKVTHANNTVALREGDPPGRLFFPAGIELIYVKFKIGTTADITFAIAGPKATFPTSTAVSENSAIVGDGSGTQGISTS